LAAFHSNRAARPGKEQKTMFEVTDAAHEKITDYFRNQPEVVPVRVFLNQGG
jgi:Fe-S cluster assembly iron-binding protein IscA